VDEVVEDGVGESGVPDDFMPGLEGELTGHQGRAAAVAVLQHLQQVASLGVGERCQPEVIEDEQPVRESFSRRSP
jgi:hypothetical protein